MADEPIRRDFRAEVTQNLVDMLEKGTAPWQKPWDPEKAALNMPFNPTTDQPYRGGNALHLLSRGMSKGYEDPRWMTYKQASEHGWQVRKGEKGTSIEFWQFPSRSDGKEAKEGQGPKAENDGTRGNAPLHRIYTVFNASQIDGVPEWQAPVRPQWEVVQTGESILAASGAKILHDQQDRAFYSKGADEIHLPSKTAFDDPAKYYGTALHELGHWTGHQDRLNRETLTKSDGFGGEIYAKEELRAELTSLFLAAERGIPHDPEQHAAYTNSWIQVLKNDKNEIFRAAKDASRASDYLLEFEQKKELEPTAEAEREQDGVEQGADGARPDSAVPAIIERETSEHVAEFDTKTGAVVITEKNTAFQARELYQPVPREAASDSLESGKNAEQQIEDGVVDGRAAPTEMPKADRAAASLASAKALVEEKLGEGSRTFNAQPEAGRNYEGPIIGATDHHFVQQITDHAAVIHESGRLPGLGVDPHQPVLIDYQHEQATVKALQVQEHVRELAEMELGG